jgi:hypothetical protein
MESPDNRAEPSNGNSPNSGSVAPAGGSDGDSDENEFDNNFNYQERFENENDLYYDNLYNRNNREEFLNKVEELSRDISNTRQKEINSARADLAADASHNYNEASLERSRREFEQVTEDSLHNESVSKSWLNDQANAVSQEKNLNISSNDINQRINRG